ncbi:MAG: holo-ACP synthase [Planctomycetota bacterium]
MIAGVGIDLVDIDRVAGLLQRHREGFLRRILHPEEDAARAARPEGTSYVAGLFAAKEAVMKALGTGMAGAAFRDIAVLREPGGKPYVRLAGGARERARALGITGWEVSITHSRRAAAAVALAWRAGGERGGSREPPPPS